jgi:pyridoxine kinase
VLAAMGHQPVALPTAVLSTHTGGLGEPARMESPAYGAAALTQYQKIGLSFDCIYSGYLATAQQAETVELAYQLWPDAYKIVDPVMGDNGKPYASLPQDFPAVIGRLCRQANLISPNFTEAHLLLGRPCPAGDLDEASAAALAEELLAIAPAAVVTGIPMDKYIACAGAGPEQFVQKKLHLSRSFPGTGDLFGALVTGMLTRGNALSAAADAGAEFVAAAIRNTSPEADPRLGVWFEPLLGRLVQHND